MDSRFHGAQAQIHHFGYFLMGQILIEEENQRHPELGRQRLDCRPEDLAPFVVFNGLDDVLRIPDIAIDDRFVLFHQIRHVLIKEPDPFRPARSSQVVQDMIHGDAINPGVDVGITLEPVHAFMDLQKDIVGEVSSRLLVRGHPVGKVENSFAVTAVDGVQRGL